MSIRPEDHELHPAAGTEVPTPDCPAPELVEAHAEGLLCGRDRREMYRHLRECPECAALAGPLWRLQADVRARHTRPWQAAWTYARAPEAWPERERLGYEDHLLRCGACLTRLQWVRQVLGTRATSLPGALRRHTSLMGQTISAQQRAQVWACAGGFVGVGGAVAACALAVAALATDPTAPLGTDPAPLKGTRGSVPPPAARPAAAPAEGDFARMTELIFHPPDDKAAKQIGSALVEAIGEPLTLETASGAFHLAALTLREARTTHDLVRRRELVAYAREHLGPAVRCATDEARRIAAMASAPGSRRTPGRPGAGRFPPPAVAPASLVPRSAARLQSPTGRRVPHRPHVMPKAHQEQRK